MFLWVKIFDAMFMEKKFLRDKKCNVFHQYNIYDML